MQQSSAIVGIPTPYHRFRPKNMTLRLLPEVDFARVSSHLEPVRIDGDEFLYEFGDQISYVYFPEECIISSLYVLSDGTTVEVGMVGNQGVLGAAIVIGEDRATNWSVGQIPGGAFRVRTRTLIRLMEESASLRQLLSKSCRAQMMQHGQRAVCNCRHTIQQRLCTWLLMTHDRVDGDSFPITQDLISRRLGARRASVTGAYNELQDLEVIEYCRGHVTITNRRGAESLACECYSVITEEMSRIFAPPVNPYPRLELTRVR